MGEILYVAEVERYVPVNRPFFPDGFFSQIPWRNLQAVNRGYGKVKSSTWYGIFGIESHSYTFYHLRMSSNISVFEIVEIIFCFCIRFDSFAK